ncbi:hypothetical protein POF50_009380 [Streptomyces sp. SL13]|uniref:Uncharacterized protein n=1 Tax=Streptantibioticus silvisoli TaxID=2705255 RepID=A0AA90GZW8_9ACTN|nr:hypothetical protein [Streptantibioticus silvisoli]MDI5963706.1 hypothetical protein [Streptantibioticus silvisoli]MDI5969546.1 hypothetical protein [Streptantibioticus silvisoli]
MSGGTADGGTPGPDVPHDDADAAADRPPHDARTEAIRLRERIYAVITMLAVVVTLTEDDHLSAPSAAWTIGGTALGVWLATVVADQQAHRVVHQRLARGRDLRVMLYTSFPLLLSAVVPLSFTVLAGLGLLHLGDALTAAVFVELAGLFAWGVLGGLRLGGGVPAAILAGVADLVIGALIVLVKVAAGH